MGRAYAPSLPRPGTAGHVPPRQLLALQLAVGNAAVCAIIDSSARAGTAVPRATAAQRQQVPPATTAPDPKPITHRGIMLNEDLAYLGSVLELMTAEKGADAADTFVKTFVGMPTETRIQLQLSGVDMDQLDRVQKAVEIAGVRWENACQDFITKFGQAAMDMTRDLLNASKKEINDEMGKLLTGSLHILTISPENQASLQSAARALATKRREANRAGNKALKSQQALYQAEAKVPLLGPPRDLKDAYDTERADWDRLEKEYAALCAEKHRDIPVLASYSYNDDGNAVERLEGLIGHGTGFFGRANLAGELAQQSQEKLDNIAKVEASLGGDYSVWKQPRILDLTKQKLSATAMQSRLVADKAQMVKEAEERSAQLRTAIAIGIGIALAVLTSGAALAGTLGLAAEAGFFGGLATGAQAFSAGLSIAAAYETLKEYSLEKAEAGTAYDKAKAISASDPSFEWLALALINAGLESFSAAAAFGELKVLVVATRDTGDIEALSSLVAAKAPKAANAIMPRAIGDAEAAGAIDRAIVATGQRFKGADLGTLEELIQKGASEDWSDAYLSMAASGKIRPLTEDALQAALGKLPCQDPAFSSLAEKYIVGEKVLKNSGIYSPETGIIFVKPGEEGSLAALVVHELTHGLQAREGTKVFGFLEEFSAYSAQRRMLRNLTKYGYKPSGDWEWLANADDLTIAQHIERAYKYPIPSWISKTPGTTVDAELEAQVLMKRIKSF